MKGNNTTTTQVGGMPGELAHLVAAAHELKSPLTLMNHLVQALRDTEYPLSSAQQVQYLTRLQLTNERMLRLIQQFAVSYRIDNEQQLDFSFQLQPVNVREVCESALHEMEPYARACGHTLELNTHYRPHVVLAQRDILHDIITNLVDNSIRHTQSGVVRIMPQHHDNWVRLTVADNGLPVARAEIKNLPHTLGRQLQPLSGRSGSSGLGLYIASRLAHAMGGSLGVGQRPAGSAFFVDLIRSRQLQLL